MFLKSTQLRPQFASSLPDYESLLNQPIILKNNISQSTMRLLVLALAVLVVLCSNGNSPVYTTVTFLYDIKRGDMPSQFQRTFQYYLSYFDMLLRSDSNLIVFGDESLEKFVWERRQANNTVFIRKELSSFKQVWYYKLAEQLRQKVIHNSNFPMRFNPQFTLEYYNPIIMYKLYALQEARQHDKFKSDFLIWNDGGYMHQFKTNVMSPENMIKQFYQLLQPQWIFITYDFRMNEIFVGFNGTDKYLKHVFQDNEPILASNFGGYSELVRDVRTTYQNLLRLTLENGDMNSDESVLTMMPFKYPCLIPKTVGIHLSNFHQKIRILGNQNRKIIHPRHFRPSFESEGSITITTDQILTKYRVKQSVIQPHLLDIEATVLNGDQTVDDLANADPVPNRAVKQTQSHSSFLQIENFMSLLQEKNTLCRRVLFRQLAFLLVTLAIYLFLAIKNKKSFMNTQESFNF